MFKRKAKALNSKDYQEIKVKIIKAVKFNFETFLGFWRQNVDLKKMFG